MSHHLLTNFESQKHYQKEPRFIGVYFRDNLPRIKDGAYVINLIIIMKNIYNNKQVLMSTLILGLIGLLCIFIMMMLLILILLL